MQEAYIEPGSISEIRTIVRKIGAKRLFILTGGRSYNNRGAKLKVERELVDYEITYFSDFNVNPELNDLKKGIRLFKESNAEILVAIGGGSVMDMGKLINYFHNAELDTLNSNHLINESFSPTPFICVPTTAGSGSESTHFAVMYIGHSKFSIAHDDLIPDFVIIDPELHYSQSPYQKAVSGVDALSQAIESLWSLNSTPESRAYAVDAFKLIWENLYYAVEFCDEAAHLKVAMGAYISGKAINISKTTAPHAFSYFLTKNNNLPHGHAVAFFLPFFIVYNFGLNIDSSYSYTHCDVANQAYDILKAILKDDERVDIKLVKFFRSINLTIEKDKLNISNDDILLALNNGNLSRLKNNPRLFDLNEFIQETLILESPYKAVFS